MVEDQGRLGCGVYYRRIFNADSAQYQLCRSAMSDHEGFEMLDETFGVREASEASSSDESPNSPHVVRPSSSHPRLQLGHTGSLDGADRLMHISGGEKAGKNDGSAGGHEAKKASGRGRERGSASQTGLKSVGIADDRSAPNGAAPSAPSAEDVVHSSAGLATDDYGSETAGGGVDGGRKPVRGQTGVRYTSIGTIGLSTSNAPTSTSSRTLRNPSGAHKLVGSAATDLPVKGAAGQHAKSANAVTISTPTAVAEGNHHAAAARAVVGGRKRNAVETNRPAGGGGADEVALTAARAATPSIAMPPAAPVTKKESGAAGVEEQGSGNIAPGGAPATHSLATTSRFVPPRAVTTGNGNRGQHGLGSTSPPAVMASALGAEDEAAIIELLGMGFDREHVVRVLKECGRGESWKEAAISMLLEPQVSTTARGVEASIRADPGDGPSACPICLSDIQAGHAFTVDCKEQHTFCVDCLHHHCSVQLLDSGLIPACPLSNMTCGHELSQEEVERVFLLQNYSAAANICKSGGNASSPSERGDTTEANKRALDACRNLLTRRGLESTGAIPCVSPTCENWMVHDGGGQRVKCGSCLVEFCGRCKRSPYHYTVDCDNVIAAAREWSSWLTEGKAAFLEAMAARDDEHKALLDQHNKRKQEHDCAVKEAERLRLEYDRMEDWKEMRCRCCPGCGRTIEKLSGCDLMVCGVDAHGGNVQNGCGAKFLWHVARPYRGDRGARKITTFTEAEPAAAARSKHFIADGIALRCDRCHRDVIGPLFRCVHCPSFACCLECQDMACRDPRHVHHTFQVVGGKKQEGSPPEVTASAASAAASDGVGGADFSGRKGQHGDAMDADDLV